jgi:hypothetical protein
MPFHKNVSNKQLPHELKKSIIFHSFLQWLFSYEKRCGKKINASGKNEVLKIHGRKVPNRIADLT